jgi:ribosome-associated protein
VARKLTDILAERAKAEADDRDLRSRTDARLERKHSEAALADLARAMVAVNDRQLALLELPEALLDAVLEARAIRSPRARDRALRVVRRELRAGDSAAIQARLAAVDRGRWPSDR